MRGTGAIRRRGRPRPRRKRPAMPPPARSRSSVPISGAERPSISGAERPSVGVARNPVDGRAKCLKLHVSRSVGKEGRLSQRASIGGVRGSWAASMGSVNELISDLVYPTSETARVIGAVAKGDLSQTMATEREGRPLEGEFLRTAKTVNTMVDQLGSFASEVTRVAREVGTEGKLGGQGEGRGVAGTWEELSESGNLMAGNPTAQGGNNAPRTTAGGP